MPLFKDLKKKAADTVESQRLFLKEGVPPETPEEGELGEDFERAFGFLFR